MAAADVSAPNERIIVTAGDDNQLLFSFDENVSDWSAVTFSIWASTDHGITPTGSALVALTDGSGIVVTPGTTSTMLVTIPQTYTATRGSIRYYQFFATIDGLKTTILRGALDAS